MQCFYVIVHGRLTWNTGSRSKSNHSEANRPLGFYCHRYVLAPNEVEAREIAFRRVRQNLDRQTDWISSGAATVDLEAEEVNAAPMHKLLKPDNKGHSFYGAG